MWSGRGTRAGSRTMGTRLRPLFRRAGLRTRAGLGRQSAPPAAGKRGPSEARAVGPPHARPRSPVPAASPPCPASTTSSWRSPSGGCCAHCAGSPCASLCRCLLVATASATPACRSFSGATRAVGLGRQCRRVVRAVHEGRARAGDTSRLCLRGRPVTSGAPTMMSRGGSDVRALGRTLRTQA